MSFAGRIALSDRVVASAQQLGVRYELVETTCQDLIPRGGSDCVDAGYALRRTMVRAVLAATGAVLWTRSVAFAVALSRAIRVTPAGVVLGAPPHVAVYSPLDGSEVSLPTSVSRPPRRRARRP